MRFFTQASLGLAILTQLTLATPITQQLANTNDDPEPAHSFAMADSFETKRAVQAADKAFVVSTLGKMGWDYNNQRNLTVEDVATLETDEARKLVEEMNKGAANHGRPDMALKWDEKAFRAGKARVMDVAAAEKAKRMSPETLSDNTGLIEVRGAQTLPGFVSWILYFVIFTIGNWIL